MSFYLYFIEVIECCHHLNTAEVIGCLSVALTALNNDIKFQQIPFPETLLTAHWETTLDW